MPESLSRSQHNFLSMAVCSACTRIIVKVTTTAQFHHVLLEPKAPVLFESEAPVALQPVEVCSVCCSQSEAVTGDTPMTTVNKQPSVDIPTVQLAKVMKQLFFFFFGVPHCPQTSGLMVLMNAIVLRCLA